MVKKRTTKLPRKPLPIVYDQTEWRKQLKIQLTSDYKSEDIASALSKFFRDFPKESLAIKYLWTELELRCIRLLNAGLSGYDKSTIDLVRQNVIDDIKETLCKPDIDETTGLFSHFNAYLRYRKLDFIEELKKKRIDEIKSLDDMKANEEPIYYEILDIPSILRIIEKIPNEHQRECLRLDILNIPPQNIPAGMSEQQFLKKFLKPAKVAVRRMIDPNSTGFFQSTGSDEFNSTESYEFQDQYNHFIRPGVTHRYLCLVAFQLALPKPTKADVAHWSKMYPPYAEEFQLLADMIQDETSDKGAVAA